MMLGLGVNLMLKNGGAATFSPADIPGLKLWLDASQITGLNDGDAVATWADLSGNGYNATQATASKRPTYQTGEQNGRPGVLGDGVDDELFHSLDLVPGGSGGPATMLIVYRATAAAPAAYNATVEASASGSRLCTSLYIEPPSANVQAYFGVFLAVGAASTSTRQVLQVQRNYNNVDSYLQGALTNFTTGTGYLNHGQERRSVFSSPRGLQFFQGYIFEVALWNRALTTDEADQLNAYAQAKWGAY